MLCYNCGKEIDNRAVICPECGSSTANPVPNAPYQPMSGFVLSIFLPFIGFIVSLVQFFRALKRKGLWLFPLLGIIIGLAITVLTVVLLVAWGALIIEIMNNLSLGMI